jgi:transposase
MKAYSIDLRRKIVESYDRGDKTQKVVSQSFGVSLSLVEKLLRRRRIRGDIAPLPHGGGIKPLLGEDALELLKVLVKEHPDATLSELCDEVWDQREIRVSTPTMCTALKKLDLGRKKVTARHRAGQATGA